MLAASFSGRQVWLWIQLAVVSTSVVLVGLGLVFPVVAGGLLLVLYALDLLCWYGLWQARSRSPRVAITLLVLTAPWELLVITDPAVEGALPLIWLLRLTRLLQLNLLSLHHERSELSSSGYIKLIRLVFNIALTAHICACLWLLLGFTNTDSWLAPLLHSGLADSSLYIRSFYWTITTMTTVGYGDITPGLDAEYLFAAAVMLVGASFYAYVIGNLASVLAQFNAQKAAYQERVRVVSTYLRNQQVPGELIDRVQGYYDSRWQRYRHFDEQNLLSDLPGALSVEVKAQLARNMIATVPLFQMVSLPIRDLLLGKLRLEFVDPGSVVTRAGELPHRIVFIAEGELEVEFQGATIGCLKAGDYFGNHSLILQERATATVSTMGFAELMYLDQHEYERIKQDYPEFVDMVAKAMSNNSEQMTEWMLEGVVL